MKWQQITVSTTHEFSEIVELCLVEAGSEGLSIKDYNDIIEVIESHNWDYAENALLDCAQAPVLVSGFFEEGFDAKTVEREIERYRAMSAVPCGSLEITCCLIDSADWENEWKKYYSPIPIGDILIVPKWMNAPSDGRRHVLLDPGMAFGTGNHETTALCIRLMQEFELEGKSVVDVGCGSGILGVCALKLGAKRCHFSDIDAQAIKATCENLRLNGICADEQSANNQKSASNDGAADCDAKGGYAPAGVYCGNLLDGFGGKADFAVANITADILLMLLGDISAALKPSGGLVISGLINDRADEVIGAYSRIFSLKTRVCDGEWTAASFVNDKIQY